jgi:15-cis-phytoene synthase
MNPDLDSSYVFCARVARREARNFYPSFLLLPADQRRSMCALYAFLRRSDDIADDPGPVAAKRTALDAWRAALAAAVAARPPTDPWPGWPALADTVERRSIPVRYLEEVLDGVAMDLTPRSLATFDELRDYCYHVASTVGLCCIHIWGFRSDGGRAEELAKATGQALQLTNIIRDVAEDARNGRVYLPAEDLERFGVDPADLTASHVSEPLRRLLAFESQRAHDDYERAESLAELIDPVGRPVLQALVGIYHALLDEIARRGHDVLAGRVSVPTWRKAAIVARALAGRYRPSRPRGVEASRAP